MTSTYQAFLKSKAQEGCDSGFKPTRLPKFLFDFQRLLVEFAIQRGRSAIFADCGIGKTPMELVWAETVHRKTNKPVLILTPLSVTHQFVKEGEKFGIEVIRSNEVKSPITVANYERLHYFKPSDFGGVVCDESSILKCFSGVTRKEITEFLRTIPYRLLCTATAAPNDYIEFGTSSEAIGELGYADMLARFFKHDSGGSSPGSGFARSLYQRSGPKKHWRFRGHAEHDFWRWLCSWARAIRKPSDIEGCSDKGFVLPKLKLNQHVVEAKQKPEGMLFDCPAHTLEEQRDERRRTIRERCEKVSEIISDTHEPIVAWCNLNDEGDLLTELIDGAVQVTGRDSDDKKEEAFRSFESGKIRVIVTKPTIAGFGLNWQHCARQTFFPSHSFEQWYQAIRRSWRFGQKRPVQIDMVTSEGEARVLQNLQRKAVSADKMFTQLVQLMNKGLSIDAHQEFGTKEIIPQWLS